MRRSMLLLNALLCASLVAAAPALAAPPTATTKPADQVTQTEARINANVSDPDTTSVTWYIQYGPTADYGTTTSRAGAGNGDVSRFIGGLQPNTTYHFRVVVESEGETVYGADLTFKTASYDSDGDGYNDSGPGANDVCPNDPGVANGYPGPGCPPAPNRDGDAYPDYQDACQDEPGGAQGPYNAQGCPAPPDSDGDGFPDTQDACPTEKGGAGGPDNSPGCPRRDSDGDGHFDSEDQCLGEVGGPASPENGNRQGCPVKDEDKDGIADVNDRCPKAGNVYATNDEGQFTNEVLNAIRPSGHKYAGCIKMRAIWYGLRGFKGFPSMKDFLKDQKSTWAMICGGACKITQTLSFDAATTKKLKLKSPVIDTISDSAPCAASGQCIAGYMFNPGPNYQVPASIKKKLAKLKKVTVLLTVGLTDTTLKEKSKWQTKIEVGTKKEPQALAEI